MAVFISLLAGFAVGYLVLRSLLPSIQRPPFLVDNFRKDKIPTAAGLVLIVTLIAVHAMRMVAERIDSDLVITYDPSLAVIALVGTFTAFGLLDDLAAAEGDRGFKGHIRALIKGRITTGSLKLFGGGLLAFAAIGSATSRGLGWLIVDSAIVALSANLINLFDLRPGRALKVSLLWGVLLLGISGFDENLAAIAVLVGAAGALFIPDLKAKLMIGDTGSNALGAALGFGMIAVAPSAVRIIFLIFLVGLTVIGDLIGFTKIINKTPALKFLDQLGRPKQ